jgi:hypothetical protein
MPTRKKTPAELNLELFTDEQLADIAMKVHQLKMSREGVNGFKRAAIPIGDHLVYSAARNQLYKVTDTKGIGGPINYPRSPYQFLLDAATRERNGKPFVVRNILDHMIMILTTIRNEIKDV